MAWGAGTANEILNIFSDIYMVAAGQKHRQYEFKKNNRRTNQTLDTEWFSNVQDLDVDLGPADTARNDSLKRKT